MSILLVVDIVRRVLHISAHPWIVSSLLDVGYVIETHSWGWWAEELGMLDDLRISIRLRCILLRIEGNNFCCLIYRVISIKPRVVSYPTSNNDRRVQLIL